MKSQSPSRFKNWTLMFAFISKLLYPLFPHLNWWWLHYAILPEILQSFLTLSLPISHSVHKETLKLHPDFVYFSYFHCYCSHLNHHHVLPHSYIHSWLVSLLSLFPPQSQQRSQSDLSKMHTRLLGYARNLKWLPFHKQYKIKKALQWTTRPSNLFSVLIIPL